MRDTHSSSEVIGDSSYKYGFTLDQLFKIATKFFKANEGKVFHPSYDDRNKFLALALQAKHGAFDESRAPPLGAFDIVGQDRRKAWANLGKMPSDDAKVGFINFLESSCPTFKLFVEAHQKEKEERERLQNSYIAVKNSSQDPHESKTLDIEDQSCVQSNSKPACQLFLTDEQRHAIKEWLNSQTYLEFKRIAEQIYPGDRDKQNKHVLILQKEHLEQFFQQPYLSEMIGKPLNSQSVTPESPLLKDRDHQVSYNSTVTPSNSVVSGDINAPTHFNVDALRGTLEELVANDAHKSCNNDENFEKNQLKDQDESESDLASIEVPQMWKNPDIKGFKDSIRQLNQDGIIKVGHGEILTIRVPTYSDGTRIFWEFATDNYDIGFGLFFEWTENPGNQVSVHISDTEEEDDDDDEILGSMDAPEMPQDPEKGPNKIDLLNEEVPSSVLIPVRRRESHEEVFVGSHTYPGKGVYLLKFDNTFSLWRSKNLYYRIYYDKK